VQGESVDDRGLIHLVGRYAGFDIPELDR